MAQEKNKINKAVKTGLALSAVAGAAYLLFGPDGQKHQKKLREWAEKIQKEVNKDAGIVKKVIAADDKPKSSANKKRV